MVHRKSYFRNCYRNTIMALGVLSLAAVPPSAAAQGYAAVTATPTYADLADLADPAKVVARVQIRQAARVDPRRAGVPKPGTERVYVEARTRALLIGGGLGESVRYLVDVPLDSRGRLPKLSRREFLVFANTVPGRPGELQLTAPDAQLPWSPELEERTRALLRELVSPEAAPRVRAIREAMHVPGNLVGEGETQIFVDTVTGEPISISVIRRPGSTPVWGVSLSEIVDQSARAPARETLTWYRLACTLPPALPANALNGTPAQQRVAVADYSLVRAQLGACPRTRPADDGALAPRAPLP